MTTWLFPWISTEIEIAVRTGFLVLMAIALSVLLRGRPLHDAIVWKATLVGCVLIAIGRLVSHDSNCPSCFSRDHIAWSPI